MPGPSDTTKMGGQRRRLHLAPVPDPPPPDEDHPRGGGHGDPPTWLLLTICFALTFVVGLIIGGRVLATACTI